MRAPERHRGMVMKALLGRWVPRQILRLFCLFRDVLREVAGSCFDSLIFIRWYGRSMTRSREADRAELTATYHILEKGLALGQPRPGFGAECRDRVLMLLDEYCQRWGRDDVIESALSALSAYCDFNERAGVPVRTIRRRLHEVRQLNEGSRQAAGGIVHCSRDALLNDAKGNFESLSRARHSLREFSELPVGNELIRRAVEMALRSPSACNRQAWHVHAFSSPQKVHAILALQGGTRGFGKQVGTVLVVTSDLRCFFGVDERHQAWVDGGLFAMSLIYALQFLGLGTCALHCCFSRAKESRFREITGIALVEPLIMAIAVGHLPRAFNVAVSARRPINEVLQVEDIQHANQRPWFRA